MAGSEGISAWIIALIVVLVVLILFLTLYLLRRWSQGGHYSKDTRINGKVVIITGANAGIGKETAIDLARRGGRIYIGCRDPIRGAEALKDIKVKSQSDEVILLHLDLASMDSIRQFSRKFHELESELHILINNAGVMACPKAYTRDSFELQIGTNHIGHFLLTNLLLNLLKQSAPSRVIVVSSILHNMGRIKKNDLNSDKSYSKWPAYAQSKLANMLFAKELAKKLEGSEVTVNSLHPGVVNTELSRDVDFMTLVLMYPLRLFFKSPLAGAQTTIMLAVDPDLEATSGKYFLDCKETKASAAAQDDETAAWLWNISEEWTGMAMPKTIA